MSLCNKLLPIIVLVIGLGCLPKSLADDFVVGVENLHYYPHFSDKGGEYEGFARAVLDAFAKEYKHKFSYEARPVARLHDEFLNRGKFDFKYPDNRYWQADIKQGKNVIYSEPVVAYIDGVMVLPAKKGKGEEHLKTLGTIRGFTPWTYMQQIEAGTIRVQESSDFERLLKMAINSRIDGAYLNIDVARYQLQTTIEDKNALVFDDSLPFTKDNYHLSTLKHGEVIQQFNRFLSENRDLIDKLKQDYGLAVD
ncbi:substrate-binding periplasmic protein [Lacimicrobium alkaliphilum]|uniref:Uncharacterized protein n=1 Tax=Lacimicrobium alkaliphilum TaxID=1526571 RepID=A0A0U3A8U3_9ALTE|nr:transporter substrate-binding domain-containing protein [Lacimicrobium alkaliphilum]ALS97438.1 hypothetical protein AT746_03555 [Lacimicrobium alkaliphilum]